ncbi:ATP-grasp domain-containing protein [Myxococcota bacterium]|nr:ATP-grasp domain-containing protein [Myxococcota bacterium]
MASFSKILVANRGEIACRVIRTARGMGYRTVAIFSDADRHAPHVALADEAVHVGGAPSTESYLAIEKILDAARRSGAQAIHPGYGFLSENPAFVDACVAAGLVFIGPPASAMRLMGDKAQAKRRMIHAHVPTAPGYLGEDQSLARFTSEAERIGYPLLVKAVAGGGGRGIRIVRAASELAAAIESAHREASSAFADGTLMLEKLIEHGRHVEIQVFADEHGHAVYLGERDCTAQRRRQKVIEEAPSPIVDPELRARMGKAAVAAALAVGYRGAGTVEFMVDQKGEFHFLEMNTRLQVEHPVTEMITGLDLVRWQLLVAEGKRLPLMQDEIRFSGHAIEARLYAEDPYAGFSPQTGRILYYRPGLATAHEGVRIDAGIVEGGEVTPFYDAMVAKVITHGADRAEAIRKLVAALEDAPLLGLRTNARFLVDLVESRDFRDARMTTTRIDEWAERGEPLLVRPRVGDETWALAAAVLAEGDGDAFRLTGRGGFELVIEHEGERRQYTITRRGDVFLVELGVGAAAKTATGGGKGSGAKSRGDEGAPSTGVEVVLRGFDGPWLRHAIGGVERRCLALRGERSVSIAIGGLGHTFTEPSLLAKKAAAEDPSRVRAPLAGVVAKLLVSAGETVEEGTALAVIEAMKMETRVIARAAGKVREVMAKQGEQVESGALLFQLDV